MISSVFIDRPRLAIVIAIVITLGGLLALTRIPVAQLPDIVPPQVEVTTRYPGASAEVLEATVAQPLESKIVGVDKMIYMKSTSGNDGSYTLTVSFELGTNPDIDTVNVNNRVQTVISQLPQEVQLQGIKVQKKSSSILQFVNLYDESGKYDPLFITNFAIINVLDELSRTPGVGEAKLFGGLDYSMRIWFDTARLTSLNLAPSDIIKAIQSQNVQASVGRIGARPVPENQQFQVNVQTQGRLLDPEQFGNIVLRANADGSTLRIKDVARVELGAMNDDNFSRLNGHPAVTIGIFLAPGANAIATAAAVNETLDKVRPRFPEGLKARATYDTTVFVNDTIHEVLKTLFEAFVLVAFVVFLFLGQLRATIVPVIAVPVSLIGGFMVLVGARLFGQYRLAAGDGACDRHRGRRRHRRGGERRARDGRRAGSFSGGRRQEGNDASHGADHRHHAGVAVGLRSGRIHRRHLGRAVPAIRGDDHRNRADLGIQRAHAVARLVRAVPAALRPAPRPDGSTSAEGSTGCATAMPWSSASFCGSRCSASCSSLRSGSASAAWRA